MHCETSSSVACMQPTFCPDEAETPKISSSSSKGKSARQTSSVRPSVRRSLGFFFPSLLVACLAHSERPTLLNAATAESGGPCLQLQYYFAVDVKSNRRLMQAYSLKYNMYLAPPFRLFLLSSIEFGCCSSYRGRAGSLIACRTDGRTDGGAARMPNLCMPTATH